MQRLISLLFISGLVISLFLAATGCTRHSSDTMSGSGMETSMDGNMTDSRMEGDMGDMESDMKKDTMKKDM